MTCAAAAELRPQDPACIGATSGELLARERTTERSVGFQAIHDAYRPKLLRYLTRLVGHLEAEDLTQNVLVKVSQGLPQFRGDSSLSTWIYRIATNAGLDVLRSPDFQATQRPVRAVAAADDDSEIEAEGDFADESTPSTEASVIRGEMTQCIRGFVERLPENYKTMVMLSELEGFKDSEISHILGISLGAVKIRLHRAREKLRQDLSTGCSFSRDARNEFACDRKS